MCACELEGGAVCVLGRGRKCACVGGGSVRVGQGGKGGCGPRRILAPPRPPKPQSRGRHRHVCLPPPPQTQVCVPPPPTGTPPPPSLACTPPPPHTHTMVRACYCLQVVLLYYSDQHCVRMLRGCAQPPYSCLTNLCLSYSLQSRQHHPPPNPGPSYTVYAPTLIHSTVLSSIF